MEVIIQMQKAVAAEMRKPKPCASIAGAVTDLVKELDVDLQPLHPTVQDATLQVFFVIIAPDQTTGDKVAKRLRDCTGIEAAYVKPLSEEPS